MDTCVHCGCALSGSPFKRELTRRASGWQPQAVVVSNSAASLTSGQEHSGSIEAWHFKWHDSVTSSLGAHVPVIPAKVFLRGPLRSQLSIQSSLLRSLLMVPRFQMQLSIRKLPMPSLIPCPNPSEVFLPQIFLQVRFFIAACFLKILNWDNNFQVDYSGN